MNLTSRNRKTFVALAGGVSLLGVVAGCASTITADTGTTTDTSSQTTAPSTETGTESTTDTGSDSTTDTGSDDAASGSTYADGTYSATGTYTSPGGNESIEVEVTLTDDVVTALTVTPTPANPQSSTYQGQFVSGINAEVVGKDIDDLAVSVVSGSSLTSGGFNQAIETIKSEAAA